MALPFLSDGAYGQAAVDDSRASCSGCSLFHRVENYLMSPFSSVASNTEWVLFVGLIVLVAYLWAGVIRSIARMV